MALFKKEKKQEKAAVDRDAAAEIEKKVEGELKIHSLPQKFRNAKIIKGGNDASKMAGLLIIIGGSVVMIGGAYLLYTYIINPSAVSPKNNTELATETTTGDTESQEEAPIEEEEITEEEDIASPVGILPSVDEEAVASTSETDLLVDETASTTAEVVAVATTTEVITAEETVATSTEDIELVVEETAATSTEEIISSEEVASVSDDGDGDGLSLKEEMLLGVSDASTDSDGDGYLDLTEVLNLYDPNGKGRLIDNVNIDEYDNLVYDYSMLYPTAWKKQVIGSDDTVIFSSQDNHFVRVNVQVNADRISAEEWYEQEFEIDDVGANARVEFNDWKGVFNVDKTVVYITDERAEYMYVLSYSSGADEKLYYKQIFNMIIRSFKID